MVNEVAMRKIEMLERQYKNSWGKEVDYTILPQGMTEETSGSEGTYYIYTYTDGEFCKIRIVNGAKRGIRFKDRRNGN